MKVDRHDGAEIGAYGHKTSIPDRKLTRGHGTIDAQGKQNIDAQIWEKI